MARVLERKLSREWISEHLLAHPGDYALRLHDCPHEPKKFDWLLFSEKVAWAIEFKVDRRKRFKYSISELPAHQKRELELFSNGRTRRSTVVVYHPEERAWHKLEVNPDEKRTRVRGGGAEAS